MRGWLLVLGQFALLGVLVISPSLPLAGQPPGPLRVVGFGVAVTGGIVVVLAAPWLGRSLTPFPEPLAGGQLSTRGLYALVRHPMYSGVLLIGWGLALRAWSPVALVAAVLLTVLLMVKARYEERLLRGAYPGYAAYAARVGRFVPGVGRLPGEG